MLASDAPSTYGGFCEHAVYTVSEAILLSSCVMKVVSGVCGQSTTASSPRTTSASSIRRISPMLNSGGADAFCCISRRWKLGIGLHARLRASASHVTPAVSGVASSDGGCPLAAVHARKRQKSELDRQSSIERRHS
eukprot:scaffold6004_cov63-Phaeocystis_antarctica.AAC.3